MENEGIQLTVLINSIAEIQIHVLLVMHIYRLQNVQLVLQNIPESAMECFACVLLADFQNYMPASTPELLQKEMKVMQAEPQYLQAAVPKGTVNS